MATQGPERARFILDELAMLARQQRIGWSPELVTPYVNTIAVDQQPAFPGDLAIEERLASLMRWNALAMVARANAAYGELGGHIASYASAADLFEVGFNHFFRARNDAQGGDLVFFQPHSAPGVYARAFLEGRLSQADLAHYRQETQRPRGHGRTRPVELSASVPDARLLAVPDRLDGHRADQFDLPRALHALPHPPQAAGLRSDARCGACSATARWTSRRAMSALTLAAREKLDNLVWVVNCNLQRLDGPVRGNGRIIDELEKLFRGAGWNVIKLVWGSDWDGLFARDTTGALARAFANTVDGQMQTFAAKDGRFNRDNFFGQNEELARLAQGMTDEQIDRLKRGGHDLVKIHAAYAAAAAQRGQPTVILAHTKKGYGMGARAGQDDHAQRRRSSTAPTLIELPQPLQPAAQRRAGHVARLLQAGRRQPRDAVPAASHRQALGGSMPRRETACAGRAQTPSWPRMRSSRSTAAGKEMSTTMAFVRMLGNLLKDKALGPRIVPIVADEARTFGMANLFKQVGIYSSVGQRYAPEDIDSSA